MGNGHKSEISYASEQLSTGTSLKKMTIKFLGKDRLSSVFTRNLLLRSLGVAALFGLPVCLHAQSNCVTAPTGLVSWWRAEGNANDNIGTNNGVLQGG